MIIIDTKKHRKMKHVWNMGFNTDHAPLLLRDELCNHIKNAKEEFDFKYIRFHDIFSDRIGICTLDGEGKIQYDFTGFDKVFDKLINIGVLPFFEISFCPEVMKTGDTTVCFYKANTSLPKFDKWYDLIKELVKHCIERYGTECVKKWYFEVWNEPDIIFFAGDMEDYFRLYDVTAEAIKSVDNNLRVGGPATSKTKWIGEFIEHINSKQNPEMYCDFVSTHVYPSDLPFLNSADGDVKLQKSDVMYNSFASVRKTMDEMGMKHLPLFMGEWNSSAGPLAFNHDERNNGAFIVKTLAELEPVIDGMLYWNLSDIYEECDFHYSPFHGGYGIYNINSVPKSSFNAFKLLSMLKGDRIEAEVQNVPKGCGVLASADDNNIYLLLYNYTEPETEGKLWNAEIVIDDELKDKSYDVTAVTKETGSAYEWWREIGTPDFLDLEDISFLYEKSKMATYNGEVQILDGKKVICESVEDGCVKLIILMTAEQF